MASPSPLDRCWRLSDSTSTLPMMPGVRLAIETHWPRLQRSVASALGDESLATEIMEGAIEQAIAYLAVHPPKDQEDINATLSRFCKEEVRRRRRQRSRLLFVDFDTGSDQFSANAPFSAADAAVDVEKILRDAHPDVREAIMLRYGSSESWSEVAARTETNPEAIRKRCKRYLNRIRRKLGLLP